MKVFISWSGDLSNKIGEKFRTWLPGVIQAVAPYYTPSDIEKGTRWETSLSKELEASEVGFFLITRENLASPWMIFEAGALAKKLDKSRVCPILFGVENTHLPAPLRSFQTTPFEESEMRKLILDTNKALGERKLAEAVVNKTFDMWWPDLRGDIQAILTENDQGGQEPEMNEREILTEILELSRLSARRSNGTGISHRALDSAIQGLCEIHQLVKTRSDYGKVMDAVSQVAAPLKFIAKRAEGGELASALEKIERFDYNVEDEDDDIPF